MVLPQCWVIWTSKGEQVLAIRRRSLVCSYILQQNPAVSNNSVTRTTPSPSVWASLSVWISIPCQIFLISLTAINFTAVIFIPVSQLPEFGVLVFDMTKKTSKRNRVQLDAAFLPLDKTLNWTLWYIKMPYRIQQLQNYRKWEVWWADAVNIWPPNCTVNCAITR